jgi:uncharacterized protein involved in tellurium resistance
MDLRSSPSFSGHLRKYTWRDLKYYIEVNITTFIEQYMLQQITKHILSFTRPNSGNFEVANTNWNITKPLSLIGSLSNQVRNFKEDRSRNIFGHRNIFRLFIEVNAETCLCAWEDIFAYKGGINACKTEVKYLYLQHSEVEENYSGGAFKWECWESLLVDRIKRFGMCLWKPDKRFQESYKLVLLQRKGNVQPSTNGQSLRLQTPL